MKLAHCLLNLVCVAAICTLIFTSCDRCGDSKVENYYIDEKELVVVPYHGYDTLVFLRNGIDTVVLHGTGKKKYTTTVFNHYNDKCDPDKQVLENYKIEFTDSNSTIIFDHYLYTAHLYVSNIEITFEKTVFENSPPSLYPPVDMPSLVVAGKTYNDIHFFPGHPMQDTLYYNWEFGILKIAKPGETWELLEK